MALNIQSKLVLALVGVVMASLWQPAASHGRLWEPPARASMWRKGFNTPHNYDDTALYCGGFQHQVSQGYKCGICGDPYDDLSRPNEAGGTFGKGVIAANYTQGQRTTLEVQLTANHKGWFEFKICPTNDPKKKATQECLDKHVLQLTDIPGTKLYVEKYGTATVRIPVVLPADLSCSHCVLQWHYHTGNSWGTDPDGHSCIGCGYQEEFYGCADVRISPASGQSLPHQPTDPPTTTTTTTTTTEKPTKATDAPNMPAPSEPQSPILPGSPSQPETNQPSPSIPQENIPMIYKCRALMSIPGLAAWCDMSCNLQFCPSTHCECDQIQDPRAAIVSERGCYATTPFASLQGMDGWCTSVCRLGFCPRSKCFCV